MEASQLEKTCYYMTLQHPMLSGPPSLKLRTIAIFMGFRVGKNKLQSHKGFKWPETHKKSHENR
jgi:hypothetical protein